jgi:SAM-dependent methyltransferase
MQDPVTAEPARLGSGLDRALPLLTREARDAARLTPAGYLDLLAPSDPEPPGGAQQLLFSRILPPVYERYWRPFMGRAVKGVFGPGMADEHRIARLLLGLSPGDGVLDVACGTGGFTREFARTVGVDGLAVGIDISERMLARSVQEAEEAGLADSSAFIRGDAAALPFRDASFDGVCCFAALNLFADPTAALDRMTAVLTPGGRIALFTSATGRTPPMRATQAAIARASGIRMFERDELTSALEQRGFVEIRQRVTGFTQFVGGRLAD